MNPLTNVKNLQKMNQLELERGYVGKKSWHDQYRNSAWIFVGGLPYDLTEGDVITVFSQYGEIANINLVRDKKTGTTKGFAFVCYEDQRSTVLAVDNLNSAKLLGRTLRVDHVADYKPPDTEKIEDEETKDLLLRGCAPEVAVERERHLEIAPTSSAPISVKPERDPVPASPTAPKQEHRGRDLDSSDARAVRRKRTKSRSRSNEKEKRKKSRRRESSQERGKDGGRDRERKRERSREREKKRERKDEKRDQRVKEIDGRREKDNSRRKDDKSRRDRDDKRDKSKDSKNMDKDRRRRDKGSSSTSSSSSSSSSSDTDSDSGKKKRDRERKRRERR